MSHFVKTTWVSKMLFDSDIDGHTLRIDAKPPFGDDSAPSPKRLLLASLAGCTGIDVISLFDKMRVSYTGLEIDAEADLTDEHPKVYSEIRLTYRIFGENVDPKKVERAINLSQDKYCGVSAMLRKNCPIVWEVEYR